LPAGKVSRPAVFSDADVVRFGGVNNTRLVFSVADLETSSGEDRCTAPGLHAVDVDGNTLRQRVARSPGAVVAEGGRFGRDALPCNHRLLHVPLPEAEHSKQCLLFCHRPRVNPVDGFHLAPARPLALQFPVQRWVQNAATITGRSTRSGDKKRRRHQPVPPPSAPETTDDSTRLRLPRAQDRG
jgi:hypothetical protein